MSFISREYSLAPLCWSSESVRCLFLNYLCPKPGCLSQWTAFVDRSRYNNAFRHLRSCYAKEKKPEEQETILCSLYEEAREKITIRGGSSRSYFEINALSEYEEPIYRCVTWMVMRNRPATEVQDIELGRVTQFNVHMRTSTLQDLLFKLVELVEKKLQTSLKIHWALHW